MLGFVLVLRLLEELICGNVTAGFAIKICDTHINGAIGPALEETSNKDIPSVLVIGCMTDTWAGVCLWEGPHLNILWHR